VLKKPVAISLEQLVKFRYIKDKNGIDILGELPEIEKIKFLWSPLNQEQEWNRHSYYS
jgi:hypothetical protein